MKYKLADLCSFEKGNLGIQKAIPGEYPLVVTGPKTKTSNSFQFDCEAVCVPLVSSTGHGHKSINYIHYQSGKFALGSILVALIPKNKKIINTEFLREYLFLLKDEILVPMMKGGANVTLPLKSLQELEIELPNIEKQLKIIDVVKKIRISINSLIESDDYCEIKLKELKLSLLDYAIQGKLVSQDPKEESTEVLLSKNDISLSSIDDFEDTPSVPKGWTLVKCTDLIDFQGGSQPSKSYFQDKLEDGMTRLFQIRDFGKKESPIFVDKNLVTKFFKKGDILLARYGASLGKVFYSKTEGAYNVALVKLLFNKQVFNPLFVYFLFKSSIYQKFVYSATRSAQAGFNKNDFNKILLPLPPICEQKRIVKKIKSLLRVVREQEKNIFETKESINKLNQSILREMIN